MPTMASPPSWRIGITSATPPRVGGCVAHERRRRRTSSLRGLARLPRPRYVEATPAASSSAALDLVVGRRASSSVSSPIAVRPIRPATASALTMCRTTPVSVSGSQPRLALGDDVEQVVGRQRRVGRRVEMVGGGVVLDVAEAGAVLAGERLVGAVREGGQREERMGRAAAAEVDLERVRLPAAPSLTAHEVDGGSADDALARQPPTDLAAPRPRCAPRTRDRPGSGSRSTCARAGPPSTWSCVDMMSTCPAGLMPELDARAAEARRPRSAPRRSRPGRRAQRGSRRRLSPGPRAPSRERRSPSARRGRAARCRGRSRPGRA